ncbi:MAG: hypothetical protein IFK94_02215 [Acidobacteria bacterium]|uniref:DUF2154 domain-containing protein n=1 Tax=Candidatus Polarisedimenticola svalbardensis TaxID=2886004 RepID=A0A8J7CC26_9BACT|nr:hypothetical protein [Candidatus Polarisedimenticola svalbardensis]
MASGKTVFKYGCFGCLGVILLVAVSLAILIGVAKMQSGKEEPAEQALSPEIPAPLFELPAPETITAGVDLPKAAGTIELDLSGGEFHIMPAAEGESLHVKAVYDKAAYAFEESLRVDEGEPWVYRVSFRQTQTGLMSILAGIFSKVDPRIDVYLPTDQPVALDLRLSKGGAEVELGGLWLTEADISMEMGGMAMLVSQPLQYPMNRLSAKASMGGFAVSHLGNASPRVLEVDAKMGGMALDLRGKWLTDSDISIRFAMGGASLELPDGVRFQGLTQSGVSLPEDAEIPLPILTFDITGEPENLEINYP